MAETEKNFNIELEELAGKVPQYISERRYSDLKKILVEMNPADIGDLMEELPRENLPLVYRILPKELASEVFVYIDSDTQELLISTFSDNELKEVIADLYIDDTVDIIEEMPASVVKRILKHAGPEMRIEINKILKYPKDSAGSVMTTEYVDLKKDLTVEDAFLRIRRTAVDKETIYTCYVKDENRHLIGLVTVKDLLLADYQAKISDIMETNIIYVNTTDDQEYVANMFTKYDFTTIPVVDNENRLVGIVTFDDAMDVLLDETTEDIEKMAAISPTAYITSTTTLPLLHWLRRISGKTTTATLPAMHAKSSTLASFHGHLLKTLPPPRPTATALSSTSRYLPCKWIILMTMSSAPFTARCGLMLHLNSTVQDSTTSSPPLPMPQTGAAPISSQTRIAEAVITTPTPNCGKRE